MPAPFLYAKVVSPEDVLYEGEAKAVSSINDKGRFDVLPQHAHFISLIKDLLIIYDIHDKLRTIKLELGLMKVSENRVNIFLGIERYKGK